MNAELFFKELQRIILSHPKKPSQILNSENCRFGNFIYYGRDLFNCFDCNKSSNGTYMYYTHNCSKCSDMDFSYESELCYECVNAFRCFNCSFIEDCANMTDSDFCYGCRGCTNVFGCVKLENKSFCIFNRQLTETEYQEKIKYLKTLPPEKILLEVEKIKASHPLTQTNERESENSSYGNYILQCRNCYLCFDTENCENCAYLYDSGQNKGSFDVSQSGEIELSYQVLDSGLIFNSSFIDFSKNISNSMYLFNCLDVKNSMGCADLEHKEFCFLNRQLTPEEYERITNPLKAELASKDFGWGTMEY